LGDGRAVVARARTPLLTVRVLGTVCAEVGGEPVSIGGPRQRALLARLVVASGAPVRGEVLAEEIWGDRFATDSVKTAISRLRSSIGTELVRHDSRGYVLSPGCYTTDAAHFEHDLVRAREHAGAPHERGALYRAALAHWRGPAFDDAADVEPCLAEGSRLDEMRLVAIGEQIDARLCAGETLELVPELEVLVAEHPWRESFTQQLMLALYRGGRQRDALGAYRRLETTLCDELGITPNPEARALHQAIIEQSEDLLATDTPIATGDGGRASRTDATDATDATLFVGRELECDHLRRSWARTRDDGRARLVVAAGPAGIGKSALLEHAAGHDTLGPAVVLRARGEQHDPVAGYAVATLLDQLVDQLGNRVPGEDLDDLAALLPVREVPTSPTSLQGVEPDLRRLRAHRAAERLVGRALTTSPVLVVLDDLHWVDPASLRLLARIVTRHAERPILVVAGCRSNEITEGGPVAAFLAEVSRGIPVSTLELVGLDEVAVRRMVGRMLGVDQSDAIDDIADDALAVTGGNPFFVQEWVRYHREHEQGQPPAGVARPATVQGTIGERLDRLPARVLEVLGAAAVLGSFPVRTLATLVGASDEEVMAVLTAASHSALVQLRADSGEFHFEHALVRQVLLERLTPTARSRLHARLVDSPAAVELSSMELAHHLCQAMPWVEPVRAASAAAGAGDEAFAALSFDDAVHWYERALQVLEQGDDDPAVRASALVGLGNALATGPESDAPRRHLESAMALAAEHRLGIIFARALLGRAQFGASNAERSAEVERAQLALDLLGGDDDFLRVRLLLWAAWQLLYGIDHADAEPYLDEATVIADRIGDGSSRAAVLQVRHALLVAQLAPLEQRRAIRSQLAALHAQRTPYEGSLIGGASVLDDLVEEGDLRGLRDALASYRRDADELGRPYERWSSRAIRFAVEMWAGDLDAAELAMREADAFGQALGVDVSRNTAAAQMLLLSWERDQLPAAIPLLEFLRDHQPVALPWIPPLMLAHFDAGQVDEARRVAVDLPHLIEEAPHHQTRAAAACVAAEAVDAIRDPYLTKVVENELAPFAGRMRVWPTAVLTFGPYDRSLGICALARDDLDEAVERFDTARLLAQQCGLALWEPRSAVWEAEALLRRGRAADRGLAIDFLVEVEQRADLIGSALLTRLAGEVRARHALDAD
jgi:DNA-binding SARP family transcriptional activator